jgi:hypothetical protein
MSYLALHVNYKRSDLMMKKDCLPVLIIIILLFSVNTYAYLDAGTGSYFIQILIGFFIGGLYTIKIFWKNIKTFIVSITKKSKK